MANYKCEGGIAYETKDTKQACLGGEARGGDGTVPYPSMSYCKKWKNSINVKVVEIEGAEHREILKNKTFWQLVRFFNIIIIIIIIIILLLPFNFHYY